MRYYVYILRRLDGRPFYVGKGSGKRAEDHLIEARHGDCHCRKCRIIQEIEDRRKEVLIDYVFDTDSPKEALAHETKLTHELSQQYNLCNKMNNRRAWGAHMIRWEMSRQEVDALLDELDLTKRERQQQVVFWANLREQRLERKWRIARLNQKWRESDQILEELAALRSITENIKQHELPF